MDPNERAFHLEEYKVVTGRLTATLARFHNAAWSAAVGSFAIFSFLLVEHPVSDFAPLTMLAWLMPSVLTLFIFLQSRVMFREIRLYGTYAGKLEKALGSQDVSGFQAFFLKVRKDGSHVPRDEMPDLSANANYRERFAHLCGTLALEIYQPGEGKPWTPGALMLAVQFYGPLFVLNSMIGLIGAAIAVFGDSASVPVEGAPN